MTKNGHRYYSALIFDWVRRVPVNSSQGQLVTAQNRMMSWPAPQTPCCHCCEELTARCCRRRLKCFVQQSLYLRHYATEYGTHKATEQLVIVDFLIRLCNGRLLSTILYPCRSSLCGNYRATATSVPWTRLQRSWFEQRLQIHTITRCSAHCTCNEQNTACALLFTLFSAQFLAHFLSNGGDRGLRVRVITAAAVRLWCLLVCLLVTSWLPLCDESTAWRVYRVTSWPVTS